MPAAVVVLGAVLLVTRSGGDGGEQGAVDAAVTTTTRLPVEGVPGGEVVDFAAFAHGMPEHIDPALGPKPAAGQVVDALYDGLTTVDISDPDEPRVVPVVAESYETNDDATEWIFTIRDELHFSDGSPVLPSSFERAWERATDPDFADPAADVFEIIEGAQEKLAGETRTIAGVRADDEERTLEVRLVEPMATFDALVAFQMFMPMPEAVSSLDDQRAWESGEMVGNGPFVLAQPRSATEVVLVPNPEWDGTRYDSILRLPEQPFLQRLTLRGSDSSFDAYAAFEGGQGQVAAVPVGAFGEAQQRYRTTFDVAQVVTYYLQVDWQHPDLGGPENRLLRQAISQAIDRNAINQLLRDGTARIATGLTPPAYPGFVAGLCDYCQFDPEAARAAFDAWRAEGNELSEPIQVQSPAQPGASDAVAPSIVEDLQAVGIDAVAEPIVSDDPDDYANSLAAGSCELCPISGVLNFLSYDSFLAASFLSSGPGNYGHFEVDDFDRTVEEARATADVEQRADLLHEAERQLLNEETGAIPLLWQSLGYAYTDQLAGLPQTGTGLIIWERVYLDPGPVSGP